MRRRLLEWPERAGAQRRVGPHGLRHSFAFGLHADGDVLLVHRAFCHCSLTSTLVYARASDERLRAAVGA